MSAARRWRGRCPNEMGCGAGCGLRVIGLFRRDWSMGLAMHYVLIAFFAVVVVVLAWILWKRKYNFEGILAPILRQ
jgi:hypothetical protein